MSQWSRYNVLVSDRSDDADAAPLVFNARTGALARIAKCRLADLQSEDEPLGGFAEFLLQHGFLVPDGCDELELIVATHQGAKASNSLFTATVELTEACNFRCLYCYQGHAPGRMSPAVADRIVRYLTRQMTGHRHLHINWFGGEPLIGLHSLRDLSGRLLQAAQENGCQLSQFITTNGYLLTRSVAQELAHLGIGNVQITVDGDAEHHNKLRPLRAGRPTYDRVLDGCANVVAAGIPLLLRVNVNAFNEHSIHSMLDDIASHGVTPDNTVIHVTRMVDHGNGTCAPEVAANALTGAEFGASWVRILTAIASRGFPLPHLDPIPFNCPFDLSSTVMIGHDGSLRHCSSSDAPIATLSEEGEEVARTELYDLVKRRNPLDDQMCRECLYLPLCMGGCSYLQELGQDKCAPERHVLPELIALTAQAWEGR
jgi:uncharacterized protein